MRVIFIQIKILYITCRTYTNILKNFFFRIYIFNETENCLVSYNLCATLAFGSKIETYSNSYFAEIDKAKNMNHYIGFLFPI